MISGPKVQPAPRGEGPHPFLLSSGSDHNKSQIVPSCATGSFKLSFIFIEKKKKKKKKRIQANKRKKMRIYYNFFFLYNRFI